jgi:5-methylcytosine-specific restriction endonuclease McrA
MFFGLFGADPKTAGKRRSPKWPALQKRLVAANPFCCVCGRRTNLVGHHKLPFHSHPELELVETNVAIVCEWPTLNCHLWAGHRGNFQDARPDFDRFVASVAPTVRLILPKGKQ